MYIFSGLQLFAFVTYLYLGIYIWAINPREHLNIACVCTIACMAIWSLEYMVVHFPHISYATARIWLNIGAIGWAGLPAALLWFTHVFTGLSHRVKTVGFHSLTTVPFLIIYIAQWWWLIVDEIHPMPYGWTHTFALSAWTLLFCIYYVGLISWSILLLIRFARTVQRQVFKALANMLVGIFFACLVFGSVTDIILPMFNNSAIPPMAPLVTLTWAAGLTYAMVKYKFLTISPAMAAPNIFATISDLVILCDPQGSIVTVNNATGQVLGLPPKKLEGRLFQNFIADDHLTDEGQFFASFGIKSLENSRLNLNTPHGKTVPVILSCSLLTDGKGEVAGTVTVAKDITEQVATMDEMRQLEGRLLRAQKMEAIGTLAGGVAHDLNNILSGIVSYPDLLLTELPTDSNLRKPLELIRSSGQKAATIVQDLLTLARRGVSNFEVVNLNRIITEFLDSPEFEKQQSFYPQVKVVPQLSAELSNINGSAVHLAKTAMNLLANSFEATQGDGTIFLATGNLKVDKTLAKRHNVKPGHYCLFQVADDGVGIADEDLDRIFEPFYTKKVMGRSGTGLGMAVVWGTVSDHKGFIELNSQPGKGTRIDLYFPATEEMVQKQDVPLPAGLYKGRNETILVVDDVAEQRTIASTILEKLGYQVRSVASGESAIEEIKQHPPDLLILDMIMEPGMDGLATYVAILAIRPNQKAIIASGYSETRRVKASLKLGAAQYIKKPYTMEILGLAVRKALDTPFKPKDSL